MALKRANQVKEKLADMLQMPRELFLDFPQISLEGNRLITIQNHRGIVEYTTEIVRINTSLGVLAIRGEYLVLKNIYAEEITVEGEIYGVEFKEM